MHLIRRTAWDFLVWIAVLFPLLTGGVWIDRPGLRLELSEVAIPVFVSIALAVLLGLAKTGDWRNASSAKFMFALWNRWRLSLESFPLRTLVGAFLVVAFAFAATSIRRHLSFQSSSYDLALFTNGLWNLVTQGRYYSAPRGGIDLLTDHPTFIMWVIAPLFRAFPSVETLLVLQALGLAAGGVSLWFLARQYFPKGHWAIALLPVLYWAYTPMRNANASDFHPEVLVLPIYLAGIAAMQSPSSRARWVGGLLLALGISCKETAAAQAVGIGVAWILGAAPPERRAFTRRAGWFVAAIGLGVFLFEVFLLPKILGIEQVYAHGALEPYGGSVRAFLLSPFTHPGVFFSNLFGPLRLKFLFWMLAPLAFLPLLAWRPLMACAPGVFLLFLSGAPHRITTQFHYSPEIAVGLFWATAVALSQPRKSPLCRPIVVGVFALAFFGRSELYKIRKFTPSPHHRWLSTEVLPCVSPSSSVSASDALVSHLATRAWSHNLFRTTDGSGKPVSCVILDPSVGNWGSPKSLPELSNDLKNSNYRAVFGCNGIEILQLGGSSDDCLRCVPRCSS